MTDNRLTIELKRKLLATLREQLLNISQSHDEHRAAMETCRQLIASNEAEQNKLVADIEAWESAQKKA